MQVDLCVFLAGLNLDAYTPLFLESLYRNCDVSNLCIHVTEKGRFESDYNGTEDWMKGLYMEHYVPGVGENVHNYLLKKQAESMVPFTIYEMHDATRFFNQRTPNPGVYTQISDYTETLNWSMDNCGTNQWVILCHSDMVFVEDIVTEFIQLMNDQTGMFGIFGHFIAVNREAYRKVGTTFNSISNFRAVPMNAVGFDYQIMHAGDPKCPADAKIIYGWDTFQLLELMMIANSWLCNVDERHALRFHVSHMCSGHGYLHSKEAIESQQGRLNEYLGQCEVQRV